MSSNSNTVCPRCRLIHDQKLKAAREALRQAYGKVALSVYQQLERNFLALEVAAPGETFGQYFEVTGAEKGEITVDYGARCSDCGLATTFVHKHSIQGVGPS